MKKKVVEQIRPVCQWARISFWCGFAVWVLPMLVAFLVLRIDGQRHAELALPVSLCGWSLVSISLLSGIMAILSILRRETVGLLYSILGLVLSSLYVFAYVFGQILERSRGS